MKLVVNIEVDIVSDAETEIEVPDTATPAEINAIVDQLGKDGKLNFPDLLDGERVGSTLSVYRVDEDGDADPEQAIEDCWKSW